MQKSIVHVSNSDQPMASVNNDRQGGGGACTLQEYRNDRKIPFILFGGKVLYRKTDIERILDENYKKAI